MKLENLALANTLKADIEKIKRNSIALVTRETKWITFNKGGQNVDVDINDPEFIKMVQQFAETFLENKLKKIYEQIEGL